MIKEPVTAEVFQEPDSVCPPQQAARLCVECQAPVNTRFCGHCGRKVHQGSVLVDTAMHSVQVLMNIDGRWRRTLRDLLLRPGQLLQHYLAGERHLYANPVLMLLVLTSLYILVMDLLRVDYSDYGADENLTQLIQTILVFSGYLAVGSNAITAWLSGWIYPAAKWPERFIVLTYASVFSCFCSFPLLLIAYLAQENVVTTPLMWLSSLAAAWVLWGYQTSIKRVLAMVLLNIGIFILFVMLIAMFAGVYVTLEAELAPFRQMPNLLSPAVVL